MAWMRFISRKISEERIAVVCSAQHEWGGKRLRDPGQLRADQWFSLPMTRHHDSFAHLVARQLASAGLDDVPVMTIDSMTAQKRLIEAGIGIALCRKVASTRNCGLERCVPSIFHICRQPF